MNSIIVQLFHVKPGIISVLDVSTIIEQGHCFYWKYISMILQHEMRESSNSSF